MAEKEEEEEEDYRGIFLWLSVVFIVVIGLSLVIYQQHSKHAKQVIEKMRAKYPSQKNETWIKLNRILLPLLGGRVGGPTFIVVTTWPKAETVGRKFSANLAEHLNVLLNSKQSPGFISANSFCSPGAEHQLCDGINALMTSGNKVVVVDDLQQLDEWTTLKLFTRCNKPAMRNAVVILIRKYSEADEVKRPRLRDWERALTSREVLRHSGAIELDIGAEEVPLATLNIVPERRNRQF